MADAQVAMRRTVVNYFRATTLFIPCIAKVQRDVNKSLALVLFRSVLVYVCT